MDTPAKPTTYARFEIGSTAGGFEVTDTDGRPVSATGTWLEAVTLKDTLNRAAASGRRALARALGAVEFDSV